MFDCIYVSTYLYFPASTEIDEPDSYVHQVTPTEDMVVLIERMFAREHSPTNIGNMAA